MLKCQELKSLYNTSEFKEKYIDIESILEAYYLAYLKVNDYNKEAKETVKEQLEVMESAMREGCVGQLPEIYDGENPTRSKGCFAQAWSVGEILRVYEAVEKCGDKE